MLVVISEKYKSRKDMQINFTVSSWAGMNMLYNRINNVIIWSTEEDFD